MEEFQDYRLSFSDEAAWWAAADAQGWVQYEYEENPDAPPVVKNKWLVAPNIDFDVIGVMYQQQVDPKVPPVLLPGWHVNIRFRGGNLPPEMAANVVLPANPRRTFSGGWFQGVLPQAAWAA